jgi:type VI secretion system protein
MFEKRLRERIMGDETARRIATDPSALLDDVLRHLRELFNVRQGSVSARPDYGMVDINGVIHNFPDGIAVLRAEIRRQIESFEPRLRDVAVRYVPTEDNALRLVFSVSATLTLGEKTQRIALEAEVGDNGFIRVAA